MSQIAATPTYYRVRKRRRHRRRRRRWPILVLAAVLCALAAAAWSALPAYGAVRDARAQIGTIKEAAASLRQAPSVRAVHAVDGHVVRLVHDLRAVQLTWNIWKGPALFVSQVLPRVHRQLEQVDPLLDYGAAVAQAGHLLDGAATPLLALRQSSLSPRSVPALVDRLATPRAALRRAAALLERAQRARTHIAPAVLPSTVQQAFRTLDPLLPPAPPMLDTLAALPAALGADGPRDYLVVPQNSEDLRASGGFVGTAAVLHVDRGRAHLTRVEDSYLVDLGHRPNADPPWPIGVHGWTAWYYRDANWSADFPTTAQLLENFYQLGTHHHVDGVIAFDSLLVPDLFDVTGPVSVPGYGEMLTSRNAFDRIFYHVNVLGSLNIHDRGSINKAFAVAAYKATFARLLALPGSVDARLLTVVRDSVRTRDLLFYANDPAVEQAIRLARADGAINPTMGDYLYVSDTNTSMNKINQFVREQISYRATIRPDRSILATTTLTYTNDADAHHMPSVNDKPFYSDFVRLFVPAGSRLLSTVGLDEHWPTFTAHAKTQFSGYFTLPSHASRTIIFHYRVPANADPGARYALLVQKQPGTAALPVDVRVSAAPGIRLGGAAIHLATTLGGDVVVTAPLAGGMPHLQRLVLGPAEPPVVPGSHPEPWVTVPTRSVAPF